MVDSTRQRVGRPSGRGTSSTIAGRSGLRYLGALGVAAVGAIHLQRYAGAGYSAIPKIGPLFLANAISSGLVALLVARG